MVGRAFGRVLGQVVAGLIALGALAGADEHIGFRGGDRWVVIGDSITHGRRYHSFLYLFYATRYPEREFRTFNCGISGDSAAGAVRRFDWDIAVHRPTVATIMLGMNDVGRGLYAVGRKGPEVERRREQCLDGHIANMVRLAELLTAKGCRILFITPSTYDQTGRIKASNCFGVNDALAYCGERLAEIAPRFKAHVIDLNGPMTALNTALQVSDPRYTLIGADRVHPGDIGQFVMAYIILKELGVSGTVAEMGVDARAGRVQRQENCTISDLERLPAGVRFTCLARSLPFPVLPAARDALDLVPFMAELNREILSVAGLPAGEYAVVIDEQVVATVTAADLAEGINLAGNSRSPMLRQALEVMATEGARHAIPARYLRTFAAQKHWLAGRNKDLDPNDFEAMKAVLLVNLERKKGASNFGYFKGQADLYIKHKPREAELLTELAAQTAAVWRLAQPRAHHFEIRPLLAADRADLSSQVMSGLMDAAAWRLTSWTDTRPEISAAGGVLRVQAPRRQGKRDMLGLTRPWRADIGGAATVKIRLRADAGSPIGCELVVDGTLKRIANYLRAGGGWETLSLPVSGRKASAITLILAETDMGEAWAGDHATYQFGRIWVEHGQSREGGE